MSHPRDIYVLIERDQEGLYVGSVPQLSGCHSQAHSLDELMERMREAAELCLEATSAAPLEFVGIQRITVREGR